ncbi:ABC transporter substrate-binding protein [Thalassotalea sp. LPB0316]|uniref:substrate-binding periplasmic protein n=1 Tax=Thalassotalea sp. LPB0316 TaxID=2769490 RepID=UPI0018683166|nr:transporter substrate-binding domain-containing protein [Thalassotalea sp. LPB0316]QOL24513.1 ABC transporter substrate-binding protein [Thalassotalea sp. LPB0316]
MRVSISAFILLLLFCTRLLAAPTQVTINDIKWPPFFFPNLEGSLPGLGKELLTTCINNEQYQLNYLTLPVKRTHLYMKSGQLDVAVYSHKISREQFVIYGKEPIFLSEYGFVSVKDQNIEINQINDLYRYQFGNLSGISHTPEILKIIEEKRLHDEVTEGYDIDAMFGQMMTSPPRFQVMANSKETFKWRAKQLGITDKVTVHPLTVKTKAYYLTVSKKGTAIKDKQAFLDAVDTCIKALKANDGYQTIASKYGL